MGFLSIILCLLEKFDCAWACPVSFLLVESPLDMIPTREESWEYSLNNFFYIQDISLKARFAKGLSLKQLSLSLFR